MHAACCSDSSDNYFVVIVASSDWERVFAMSFKIVRGTKSRIYACSPRPFFAFLAKKGRGGEIALVSFKFNETSVLACSRNVGKDEV